MKIVCIIPSRYDSKRFPGKPLALISGKTMIQRVYLQAKKAFDEVWVATDDPRIENEVASFGGNTIMTSNSHKSGTDRCAEAVFQIQKIRKKLFEVVINLQGDEPFIDPQQLAQLSNCFRFPETQIASLVKKITNPEDVFNPNLPKVIFTNNNNALYFSRSPIPYVRDVDEKDWVKTHSFFRHIGIYGYRTEILSQITQLPQSTLELSESLEQNRWLQNGFRIKLATTDFHSIGIDTPEDLLEAEKWLHENENLS